MLFLIQTKKWVWIFNEVGKSFNYLETDFSTCGIFTCFSPIFPDFRLYNLIFCPRFNVQYHMHRSLHNDDFYRFTVWLISFVHWLSIRLKKQQISSFNYKGAYIKMPKHLSNLIKLFKLTLSKVLVILYSKLKRNSKEIDRALTTRESLGLIKVTFTKNLI